MKLRNLTGYGAVAALALFVGCNIFNPSGDGDAGSDSQANLSKGEELYRQRDFAGAMAAFSTAINLDSNNSMAYYGYAKAVVHLPRPGFPHGLDPLTLLKDFDDSSSDSATIPFLNHRNDTLSLRLQVASQVNKVLSILTKRDTLTTFFNYLQDTASPSARRKDSLRDDQYPSRVSFMKKYLAKAAADSAGYYKSSRFPLTDYAMPYAKFQLDFVGIRVVKGVMLIRDLDGNDTIDSRDDLTKKLLLGGSGGLNNDSLKSLGNSMYGTSDSAIQNRNNINNLLQRSGSDISSAGELLSAFSPKKDSTDTSSGGNNIDGVVSSLGKTLTFYQFGDEKDNDGDGCIDEEVLDSKDNDEDGFVEEDARLNAPTDTFNFSDLIDNNHDGVNNTTSILLRAYDPLNKEAPVGPLINSAHPGYLGFVNSFYSANSTHPESTWVHIRKGADDSLMELRLHFQNDSLLKSPTKIGVGGVLRPQLDSARALIGGCWRNY